MKQVIVVGSLNADLVQPVQRLPLPGETVAGGALSIMPGGKGANQACAAARFGAPSSLIGRLGSDLFANVLEDSLTRFGVSMERVGRSPVPTGTAVILVLKDGENVILISPGANGAVTADWITQQLSDALRNATSGAIVACQLEIPLEATQAALSLARAQGASTILDPAPAQQLSPEMLQAVDYLTPNQTEAAKLLESSSPVVSVSDARDAAAQLSTLGVSCVILKLGSNGCVVSQGDQSVHVPGFRVEACDTTAAGDTFNGALAAMLADGQNVWDAVRFANAAAAISVTRPGAQASIPSQEETRRLLESNI